MSAAKLIESLLFARYCMLLGFKVSVFAGSWHYFTSPSGAPLQRGFQGLSLALDLITMAQVHLEASHARFADAMELKNASALHLFGKY